MPKPKIPKQKVTFTYVAPAAQTVLLAGDFTDWERGAVSLKKDKGGVWKKTLTLVPGQYEYRLLVDGQWQNDPQCSNRRANRFGSENCVCIVNGPPP